MSLMDCVRSAQDERHEETTGRPDPVVELKRRVCALVPPETLVAVSAVSPQRARNEIRSAAARVFAENPDEPLWRDRGPELVEALIDAIFGLGPLEDLLADDSVTEIMVNGTSSIYFERDGRLIRSKALFSDDEQVRSLIDRIIAPLGRRIDEASPMVDARLPLGHRVHAIIPPLALDGPILTIRKFSRRVYSLDAMRDMGTVDERVRRLLAWAVRRRCNIAVSGGTGSGKTTLLNALSCEIPFEERIVTIEDSAELRFSEHPHVVRLEARAGNAEGTGRIDIRELVINALRMRPDRIVVGECRGAEALDMLQAMNTGHDGSMTTLHANSPYDALTRLTTMVRYAVDLPVDVIEAQVAGAINLMVQVARGRDGRRFVTAIVGYSRDRATRRVVMTPYYERDDVARRGRWMAEPDWVASLVERGIATEGEVDGWRHAA